MFSTVTGDIPVIDADSHITEPADIWTARVASKYRDLVPRVEMHPKTSHHHWRIGDTYIWPVGYFSTAGVDVYPPDVSWEYSDVDPGTFDAAERLNRMDEYGVDVQILFPNVIGFQSELVRQLGDDLATICAAAYNDFMLEWCKEDTARLVPIAMLPYWSREDCLKEIERCASLGFKGLLFADKFERAGLPNFCDQYWDPVYAAAQDAELSMNYHVGFLSQTANNLMFDNMDARHQDPNYARDLTRRACSGFLSQAEVFGQLLTSGLCDRFPSLKLVATESGFGYLPFYLEALDWHWKGYGEARRGGLLPSEHFRRQCYGTFWFERSSLPLLEQYPDNFMFSTDYPHGTSLSPGPASPAEVAWKHLREAFADIDEVVTRKVIFENAQSVYKIPLT